MKFVYLLFINLSLSLASCQTKTENAKSSEKKDCTIFYKKFRESVVSEQTENALTYIDQAIKCDPTNKSFKSNKLRFLIDLGKYEDAIELIDNFNSDDTSFKMLKAVLKLKIKDSNSMELLKQCYDEYRSEKKITADKLIYKIALTNFFSNKDEALKEIEYSKKNLTKENERDNLDALEELIHAYNKQDVLFKLFNIEENDIR